MMKIKKLIGKIYLIEDEKYLKEVEECGNIHFYKLYTPEPKFYRSNNSED